MATAGGERQHSRTAFSAPTTAAQDRDQRGNGVHVRVVPEDQEREVEEIAVEAGEAFAQPRADDEPMHDADAA